VLWIRLQISLDAIDPTQSLGNKSDRLVNSFVRLGAAKAEEATTGFAEALASQAGDSEGIVGAFEQVHRQAMRCDS
jgi:hypothetical protein